MWRGKKVKMRKGAASFYIVAFSTLILVIIAASFTAVVLSEMARSANDDLSQSAYDSALAGVEDAKIAFYNYQKCADSAEMMPTNDTGVQCGEIVWYMRHPECAMVAKILGRVKKEATENDNVEVVIEESSGGAAGNNMQQAYTCAIINTILSDYRSTLTESNPTRVVKVKLGRDAAGNPIKASDIVTVKISWFAEDDYSSSSKFEPKYSNINNSRSGISFPTLGESDDDLAVPPMISVGLVQTAANFSLEDFEKTEGGERTNRGTVFLVPTGEGELLPARDKSRAYGDDMVGNYISAYSGTSNYVSKDLIVKSNDKSVKNLPIAVYCDSSDSEFACSTTIELPGVIGGIRNDDTFMFAISLPYGQPNTSFSMEFYKAQDGGGAEQEPVTLDGMQIMVDSTGRANNLYRRVEARLDPAEANFPYPFYAIELLGDDDGSGLLRKPNAVTCEWTEMFGGPTCSE